jgi:hypothetical protein
VEAATIQDLLRSPIVLQALEEAWLDSLAQDPQRRHEEGGWVYMDVTTGALSVRRAPKGVRSAIDLCSPEMVLGSVVVATFHTHPNPAADGWDTGPSTGDTESAWTLGVPCFIRAEDGVHCTGPPSRRGGLAGPPGFPF